VLNILVYIFFISSGHFGYIFYTVLAADLSLLIRYTELWWYISSLFPCVNFQHFVDVYIWSCYIL